MNIYKKYAKLKLKEKQLKQKLKDLELEVLSDLMDKDGEKLETEYATFSLIERKKYKYSKELLEKEKLIKDKLKVAKREEELKGKAELISAGSSVRCQLRKVENAS